MALLFRALGRLSLAWLHRLGALLGWAGYLASPSWRRHLRDNLSLAYAPPEAERIRRACIGHAGRGFAELPHVWLRERAAVLAQVRSVEGWELASARLGAGQGIVFLTPHLGCFEVAAQFLAEQAPMTALYRPPKQAWLQPLVEEGRSGFQYKLAPSDLSGVRALVRALRRRETILILPDQVPSFGEGVWAPFFGRPAYTMTLAARLSEMPDVAVLLIYAERLPDGGGYRIRVRAPAAAIDGSTQDRANAINREIEAMIRECPEQYLWGYNRYKVPAGAQPPAAA